VTGLDAARAALGRRLRAVAEFLTDDDLGGSSTATCLDILARAVARDPHDARIWLLATAVAGGYPTSHEVVLIRRELLLARPGEELGAVLTGIAATASAASGSESDLELVIGGVLVDVHFCATHAHNTGIQRVVRNTAPFWVDRGAVPVAWTPDGTGYRRLGSEQEELALRWRSGLGGTSEDRTASPVIVPIGGTVLVPEVPAAEHLDRLTAVAAFSGARVGLIGYDAIPIASAEDVPVEESNRFANYVTLVKHATTVSAISATTAEEFRGIRHAVGAQGLRGPEIMQELLPQTPLRAEVGARDRSDDPLVLMVGSIEPRKNQLGALAAGRLLHRRGVRFRMVFVGGGSAVELERLRKAIGEARADGMQVELRSGLRDAEMTDLYAQAACFVFPSLQEGYGLPIAEALSLGVPVVTSDYGAMAEVAAAGGCLLVDPRDDAAIAEAVASILEDDSVRSELEAQIRHRPAGTWEDYADVVWRQLVVSE